MPPFAFATTPGRFLRSAPSGTNLCVEAIVRDW
jgi:hypothetical protein